MGLGDVSRSESSQFLAQRHQGGSGTKIRIGRNVRVASSFLLAQLWGSLRLHLCGYSCYVFPSPGRHRPLSRSLCLEEGWLAELMRNLPLDWRRL